MSVFGGKYFPRQGRCINSTTKMVRSENVVKLYAVKQLLIILNAALMDVQITKTKADFTHYKVTARSADLFKSVEPSS